MRSGMMFSSLSYAFVAITIVAGYSIGSRVGAGVEAAPTGLTAQQKRTAEELTSCFENSTPVIQYGYCEALNDGRGTTAGRAGFVTRDGDLLQVVNSYLTATPAPNPASVCTIAMTAVLPALKSLAKSASSAVGSLPSDFCSQWRACASAEPVFRYAQNRVVDETYYQPAMALADAMELSYPITRAQLYDAAIQHGTSRDTDGLPFMIGDTNAGLRPNATSIAASRAIGPVSSFTTESVWLNEFLRVRTQHLLNAANSDTRKEWKQSVDRVACFQRIVAAAPASNESGVPAAYRMELPLAVSVFGAQFTLTVTADTPTNPPLVVWNTATGSPAGDVGVGDSDDGTGSGKPGIGVDTSSDTTSLEENSKSGLRAIAGYLPIIILVTGILFLAACACYACKRHFCQRRAIPPRVATTELSPTPPSVGEAANSVVTPTSVESLRTPPPPPPPPVPSSLSSLQAASEFHVSGARRISPPRKPVPFAASGGALRVRSPPFPQAAESV